MSPGIWLFVLAILIVVMVHESGHFLVAKHFGFKATQFFLGFGPTVWSFKRGETEYGVKALPLGGFVKILGMNPYEDIAPEDRARTYGAKPAYQRALLLVAGSATHWVLAFLLLVGTSMIIGFPTGEATSRVAAVSTRIDGHPTAATELGLRPGDRIVGVGDEATESWRQITSYIREHGGATAQFAIQRQDGATAMVEVELGEAIFSRNGRPVAYAPPNEPLRALKAGETRGGFLGVEPEPEFETKGLIGAVGDSGRRTAEVTVLSVRGLGDLVGQIFGGELLRAVTGDGARELNEGPLGLVGASRLANDTIERGQYLQFIALIVGFTVFVGMMNLLPLPPLDGGHLAVVAYEAVTGRNVDIRKLIPISAAVISFFILLFLAVLYLDLARPIRVPF